jgi:hypothetical protein
MGRRHHHPKPKLTHEQKLLRRQQVITDLQKLHGTKVVIFGDCAECLLPLTYPGVELPDVRSLKWTEAGGELEVNKLRYCLDCADGAVARYRNAVQSGLTIGGVCALIRPKADPGVPTPDTPGLDTGTRL